MGCQKPSVVPMRRDVLDNHDDRHDQEKRDRTSMIHHSPLFLKKRAARALFAGTVQGQFSDSIGCRIVSIYAGKRKADEGI